MRKRKIGIKADRGSARRRANALQAVESVQRRSVNLGLDRLSLADINKEIRAARLSRLRD